MGCDGERADHTTKHRSRKGQYNHYPLAMQVPVEAGKHDEQFPSIETTRNPLGNYLQILESRIEPEVLEPKAPVGETKPASPIW